jgi:hypothetical protein
MTPRISHKAMNGMAQLSRHLWAPPTFTATGIDLDGRLPVIVDISAEWSPDLRSYVVVELLAKRQVGGDPITGSALRSVPVGEVLAYAVRMHIDSAVGSPDAKANATVQAIMSEPGQLEALRSLGPKPETLEAVAVAFELAQLRGIPAGRSLTEAFGIPKRTADHWVKLARERGHLDPLDAGGRPDG